MAALDRYPTTLDEDERLLAEAAAGRERSNDSNGSLGDDPRVAFLVQLRRDEKRTLQWWSQLFERGIAVAEDPSYSVEQYWQPWALTGLSTAEAAWPAQAHHILRMIYQRLCAEAATASETPVETMLVFGPVFVILEFAARRIGLDCLLIGPSSSPYPRLIGLLYLLLVAVALLEEQELLMQRADWRPLEKKISIVRLQAVMFVISVALTVQVVCRMGALIASAGVLRGNQYIHSS